MPSSGIKIPFQRNSRGLTATDSGDSYLAGLILVALNDCDSANPFQDLGIGENVFSIQDSAARSKIAGRISNVFDEFKRLEMAELSRSGIKFSDQDGETIVNVDYISLESGKPQSLTLSVGQGGFQSASTGA